jgi:hypothetical protein
MPEEVSDWASLEEALHHGHGEGLDAGRDVEGISTAGGAFRSRMVLREEGRS